MVIWSKKTETYVREREKETPMSAERRDYVVWWSEVAPRVVYLWKEERERDSFRRDCFIEW